MLVVVSLTRWENLLFVVVDGSYGGLRSDRICGCLACRFGAVGAVSAILIRSVFVVVQANVKN